MDTQRHTTADSHVATDTEIEVPQLQTEETSGWPATTRRWRGQGMILLYRFQRKLGPANILILHFKLPELRRYISVMLRCTARKPIYLCWVRVGMCLAGGHTTGQVPNSLIYSSQLGCLSYPSSTTYCVFFNCLAVLFFFF